MTFHVEVRTRKGWRRVKRYGESEGSWAREWAASLRRFGFEVRVRCVRELSRD